MNGNEQVIAAMGFSSASGPIKVDRAMDGWLLPDPEMMNAEWASISSLHSLILLSGTTLTMVIGRRVTDSFPAVMTLALIGPE